MMGLAQLLPLAIEWAETTSNKGGRTLTEQEQLLARVVGVRRPELVRVGLVEHLALPDQPLLRELLLQAKLLGPSVTRLTLGYEILIVRGSFNLALLSHELRHVHQCEAYGGIRSFLPVYLQQIAEGGFEEALFERDARAHELSRWK